MTNRVAIYVHSVTRLPVFAIWQPCCTDMATLLVVHISKCFHSIPHPQKHGFSKKIYVSKSIRTKVTHNVLKFQDCQIMESGNPVKPRRDSQKIVPDSDSAEKNVLETMEFSVLTGSKSILCEK